MFKGLTSVLIHHFRILRILIIQRVYFEVGHSVAQLVKTLCYKLEGRRFDFR
jgi:hypothetical protein